MPRIDSTLAEQIEVKRKEAAQRQVPAAGSEAALRQLISGIAAGSPNYAAMSSALADATRRQLPQLQPAIAGLGEVRTLQFQGVSSDGWDTYQVRHERGTMHWRIVLASDGKIAGALVTPGP